MEMARFKFMERLDLFRPGMSFDDVGLIIADVQCSYKAPLKFPGDVQVYLRTAAIGKKSFTFHYRVETAPATLHAMARSVQVAYDYRGLRSIHVPDEWRARLRPSKKAGNGKRHPPGGRPRPRRRDDPDNLTVVLDLLSVAGVRPSSRHPGRRGPAGAERLGQVDIVLSASACPTATAAR
jgi:acyl-CoA thioesterase FadM